MIQNKNDYLFEHEKIKKIAVFRALQLGDMLCSIPALRALKGRFPKAEIILIGLPWAKFLAERFPLYINRFISFPGYPGFIEQGYDPKKVIRFILKIQKEEFDLIIQMHGNGSISNPLIQLFGGKISAGYYSSGFYCPNFLRFIAYSNNASEVERNLELMEFLDVNRKGDYLEFPIFPSEEIKASILLKKHRLTPYRYVCIHSGARDNKRRWDPSRFAKVADSFAGNGYKIVLTGLKSESLITGEVYQKMRTKPVNLTGKTNLGLLAGVLKKSAFLLSNDTGIAHLADALAVPSITLYRSENIRRWAPVNQTIHRIINCDKDKTLTKVLTEADNLIKQHYYQIKN